MAVVIETTVLVAFEIVLVSLILASVGQLAPSRSNLIYRYRRRMALVWGGTVLLGVATYVP